jgi:integrase
LPALGHLPVDQGTKVTTHKWNERLGSPGIARADRVYVTTEHGLRGTLSTLATAAGASLLDLSKMLGHADGGKVATQHYIKPGTGAAAARERGMAVLQAGTFGPALDPSTARMDDSATH